jgi:hypothetical protein
MAIKRWNASTSQWELVGTPGTATPAAIGAATLASGGNTFLGVQTITAASEWPLISRFTNPTSTHRNHLLLQRSNNNAAVTSGFGLGGIAMSGHDGTNYGLGWNGGAEITAYASQNWTPSARGTSLAFSTTPDNSTTILERMRIQQSGDVVLTNQPFDGLRYLDIYNTSSGNSAGAIIRLITNNAANTGVQTVDMVKYRNGTFLIANNDTGASAIFQFNNSGAERMRIDGNGYLLVGYTGSQGAYRLQVNSQIFATSSSIATSDGRYKENVLPISSGLDIIDSLNPVSFDWKDHPIHNFVEGKTVGFIAQEVKESLKDYEWVNNIIKTNTTEAVLDEEGNEITPAEEFLGIAESNIIPLLVAAVKELRAEVNTLKAQITN